MNFTVSSSAFLKQLTLASGALSANPVMSILEDFLLDLKGNRLSISTTNLEISIQTAIEVTGKGKGKIALSGKTLLETLKALPDQPVTFNFDLENRGVEIISSSGKYKMVGEDPVDYPEINSPSDEDKITLQGKHILAGIERTIFATSNDEMRQTMRGVCLSIDLNHITFAATDAHKLVKSTFLDIHSDTATSIIFTKKTLLALKGILKPESEVILYYNKSKAYFEFDEVLLSARLIDGKFPDFNAVIPVNNKYQLRINRQDFISALRRLVIYANKSTNQISLDIQSNSLTINAQDLDMNSEGTEQLICSYNGDPIELSLNGKYLIELFNVIESEEVVLEFNSANKPVIIFPSEQIENENLTLLVVTNF